MKKVISLWLDKTSDPDGATFWVVSRDTLYPDGSSRWTDTIKVFPRLQYEKARLYARLTAEHEDLELVQHEAE